MELQRIGPYEIDRKLGAGGMGTVYLARHQQTRQQVAVKILPALLANEAGFVARFTREIEALKKLSHPNVVELYDSGVDQDVYYYAMEYVDGETLTARLKRDKRIPWPEVIDIAVQICGALKAAHNAGVIHRDLKPSNLLLRSDGAVKLTDFGVAQVFASGKLTITGGVIGTAEYMSPEQATGKRATKQSDVYALGAVMYVMATGRPPFIGNTAIDVARKHQSGRFDSPRMIVPEIPFWLDEVICKCLEKRPEDRYPDAYVLSLRLQEITRKVALAQQDQTVHFEEGASPTAVTLAGDERPGEGIGGTLVRDLVRAQLEPAAGSRSLSHWLDNTWVLVALLAGLVLGGFWWFRKVEPTPQQMFDAGVALMDKPAGAAWQEARARYFEPLLELDRDTWEPQVRPLLQRISLHEMTSDFRRPLLKGSARRSRTEVERLLRRGIRELEGGDDAAALKTLSSLATLLPPGDDYAEVRATIDDMIAAIQQERAAPTEELWTAALERASRLAQADRRSEAESIWQSILNLYDANPEAVAAVRRQREEFASRPPTRPPVP
jgi:serine/threonine-protein kinase